MSPTQGSARSRIALAADETEFARDVLAGLSRPRKSLPCRYFYDAHGSALFEEITNLPEYYPTRTETAILAQHAHEMVAASMPDSLLVEFGSGTSRKTELLIEAIPQLAAYMPIDVSPSALHEAKCRLGQRFPKLTVRPIVADFSEPLGFPPDLAELPKIGFFPGSTIGNFASSEAIALLRTLRQSLVPCGRLIIGVDLKKDARRLVLAYNDAAGVTAAFNLNLLTRINRELGATFDLAKFRHEAIYDPREGRIEMQLVSRCDHAVDICRRRVAFKSGETIHTENSYKYSVEEFRALAARAGWQSVRTWTDPDALFSVHDLEPL